MSIRQWRTETDNFRRFPCMIDDEQCLVQIHGADVRRFAPEEMVRVRLLGSGYWENVLVRSIATDEPHFNAGRIDE